MNLTSADTPLPIPTALPSHPDFRSHQLPDFLRCLLRDSRKGVVQVSGRNPMNRCQTPPLKMRGVVWLTLCLLFHGAVFSAEIPPRSSRPRPPASPRSRRRCPRSWRSLTPKAKAGARAYSSGPMAVCHQLSRRRRHGPFARCGLSDGKLYDAVTIGIDPTGDVALIQLQGRTDFPVAEIADSDTVQIGDWCYAMGNPFCWRRLPADSDLWTGCRDAPLSIPRRDLSGIHRLPAGRRFDQSRELGRPAVQCQRTADRY